MNPVPCGVLLAGQDGPRMDRQALAAQLRARRGGGLALTHPACVFAARAAAGKPGVLGGRSVPLASSAMFNIAWAGLPTLRR